MRVKVFMSLIVFMIMFTSTIPTFAVPTTINHTQKLLIYYGQPIGINGTGKTNLAAAQFAKYDVVVLGANIELATHSYHKSTINVIRAAKALNPNLSFFGYIYIGVSTKNSSLNNINARAKAWKAMGVRGIFLDACGYDFAVTRARFNSTLDIVHSLNLNAFVNAWNAHDIFGNIKVPTYNPRGVATKIRATDLYLLESFALRYTHSSGYPPSSQIKTRAEIILAYRKKFSTKVMASNTLRINDYSDSEQKSRFKIAESFALYYALNGYGVDVPGYSAKAPYNDKVVFWPYIQGYNDDITSAR